MTRVPSKAAYSRAEAWHPIRKALISFLGFLSLLWPFLSAACKTQKAQKALHRNTALKICVETCLRIYIHCRVRGCEWAQRKLNRIVVCISCSFKHKLHYYSYIQQRIFSIKRKRRQKLWFIFPLHRNCNISLWLFPPLSEEISAIKIAISALKCCIKPFKALLILFILHIAGRMSPRICILFAYIYRRRLSYRPSVWWWSHSARSALHLYYFLYFLINC